MNRKHTDSLTSKFWFYIPDGNVNTGMPRYGFDVGDGWYNIVKELSKELYNYINDDRERNNKYRHNSEHMFRVLRVDSKFGGMKFKVNNIIDDKTKSLIERAEAKSYIVCEDCGKAGLFMRFDSWYKTLCKRCGKEREYKPVEDKECKTSQSLVRELA